jgi:uncharacterized protein with HEPN domain
MLGLSGDAVAMLSGGSREDLDRDRKLDLALVRLLEIIGEAASRVPLGERNLYPEIPWYEIVGLRNRLIHGCDSVDFNVLWRIVCDDLPSPIATLAKITPPGEEQ